MNNTHNMGGGNPKLIIVGSGGFAKEIYSYIKHKYEIAGFISLENTPFYELKYLGNDDNFDTKLIQNSKFIVAIGKNELRKKIIEKLSAKGCEFFTLICDEAIIANDAQIGIGAIITPNVMINANAKIGDFVICNIFSSVAHDCELGDFCILSPYATLNGGVKLGSNCFLGTRVSILPNLSVADNCVISAGCVVSKSCLKPALIFCKIKTIVRQKLCK